MSWNLRDLEESLLIGSTLVEGSTLSESQATAVLQGRTISGHPLTEIRELLNYRSAVEWLIKQLALSPFVSIDLILTFHERLFQGFPGTHGRWKTHKNYTHLSTGARHDYLHPGKVASAMNQWISRFNETPPQDLLPIATELYYDFEQIHPFEDGNGRIGRLLVAYWLHWKSHSTFKFKAADKLAHLQALEAANDGKYELLVQFFKDRTELEPSK